jgi:hypothetical protein
MTSFIVVFVEEIIAHLDGVQKFELMLAKQSK